MSEVKLKPCPFCGGEAKKMKGLTKEGEAKWFDVGCSNEMCSGFKRVCLFESESEAIEAWNTRKPIDDIVERLEECEEYEAEAHNYNASTAFNKAIEIVKGGVE